MSVAVPNPAITEQGRAWLVVAAAFIGGFVVFGVMYSFGAFFMAMVREFDASRTAASGFFSATGCAFYILGAGAGHLADRWGPRIVVATGAVVMGGSLVLTAFIEHLWVGYLTYGVGMGLGAACAYVPTLSVVGGWFTRRRATALGIAAAGTGCGMLAVPPLSAALIESYGWRQADIVLGIGSSVLLAFCALAVLAPPVRAAEPAGRTPSHVIRSRPFVLLYLSWVLATTGLFVPFVFLPAFAQAHGASDIAAASLLSLLGGASVLGRVGIGSLAEKMGSVRLFKTGVLVMGASYVLWLASPGYVGLAVFAVLLGLGYGVRIALLPSVLIDFFGLRNQGAILGMFFTASGIATLLGALVAGAIVDHTGSDRWGIVFALAMGLAGFVAILPLKAHADGDGRHPGQ
ncbi:MFS transporter [Reyranella sp. CPCC 100927]|uniref:MFS transporter n=1 Tax=Reyranella sp. CPCC 100927 TaxID=2599616 RepID=UPI0011B41704|nr:MFS transporter [Reyranella sp. CPCC 100927]TWT11462.1 MFS transporter [Reyranella sp. CPCC 100927]